MESASQASLPMTMWSVLGAMAPRAAAAFRANEADDRNGRMARLFPIARRATP